MALVYAYLRYSVPVSGDSETAGFATHTLFSDTQSTFRGKRIWAIPSDTPVLGLSAQ